MAGGQHAPRPHLLHRQVALPDPDEIPPFTDHSYPERQAERVRWSTVQYLRTIDGLLPGAPRNPIDARSFDFDLLAMHDPSKRGRGVNQFDQQYWRANIDPNERFTLNVADTVRHRLDPWDSKFDNLVLAGDWTYTGFNLGSFEGATMSGKLRVAGAHGSTGVGRRVRLRIPASEPHRPELDSIDRGSSRGELTATAVGNDGTRRRASGLGVRLWGENSTVL